MLVYCTVRESLNGPSSGICPAVADRAIEERDISTLTALGLPSDQLEGAAHKDMEGQESSGGDLGCS